MTEVLKNGLATARSMGMFSTVFHLYLKKENTFGGPLKFLAMTIKLKSIEFKFRVTLSKSNLLRAFLSSFTTKTPIYFDKE